MAKPLLTTLIFMIEFKYRVTSETDGLDCDGPITHGRTEEVLTYDQLAHMLGYALLRYGESHFTDVDEQGATVIFGKKTDEGFSRTTISFTEVES